MDANFISSVKENIRNIVETPTGIVDNGVLWDTIKCSIRGTAISFSAHKARERPKYLAELIEKIEGYEKQILDGITYDHYCYLKKDF